MIKSILQSDKFRYTVGKSYPGMVPITKITREADNYVIYGIIEGKEDWQMKLSARWVTAVEEE